MYDWCDEIESKCTHDCVDDDGVHCPKWRDENGLTWQEHCQLEMEPEDYSYGGF